MPARVAIERLMLLDAVLASPDLNWLTTDAEKAAFAATVTPLEAVHTLTDNPIAGASARNRSDAPGTYSIGLEPSGRAVLLYLATVPWTEDFRRFLQGHAALLRAAHVDAAASLRASS